MRDTTVLLFPVKNLMSPLCSPIRSPRGPDFLRDYTMGLIRFQTTKVTFKCLGLGATYDFLLVFHCNYIFVL